MPRAIHASNMETFAGDQGAQGTHMDALGHFGALEEPWDGREEFPTDQVRYYGGFDQALVKPIAEMGLHRLGVEKVPPIITTAVLLDAKQHIGNGSTLEAGRVITSADIQKMLTAQGLESRGLLPGDVLYIHTGWGEYWKNGDSESQYYGQGPGLAYDAAKYIEERAAVLIALDNPFTDAVNRRQLKGEAPPAVGYPAGMPFAIHHHCLVEAGIHQIQNAKLDVLAKERVWLSCTIVLPLLIEGGCGSLVRPIAIGVPGQ
jgi:kynurenine formamidase